MRILPILLVVFAAATRSAFSQDASAPDTKTILDALKTIKEKQQTESKTGRAKILQELSAAASSNASAIEFYQEAVRATQFAGENREQTQFHDWKKKVTDQLRGSALQNAARLHLAYLVITLQRAFGAEVKSLIPSLVDYTRQVTADVDELYNQDLMTSPLTNSVFTKWYQLEPFIGAAKNWEMTPGNVDAIFQKTILPELRKEKDPRVIEYWDDKILSERNAAEKSQRAFNADVFDQTRKPALLWLRAEDELAIGQRNRAIDDMYSVIKNFRAHPEIQHWITRLEAVIGGAGPVDESTADTTTE